MNWKKRVGIVALVGVMVCGITGCNTPKSGSEKVKNIIFMIGDGMGYNAIDAAETLYKKELKNERLSMKSLPVHGSSITYSMSNQVTDSAAGGTALSTGYKTGNKIVAKSMDKSTDYKTTLELAAEKGKSTGIVVTTPTVDATPASFTAHVNNRELYEEIAKQQLEKLADGTLDLVMGGGQTYYECDENQSYLNAAEKEGITYTKVWKDTQNAFLPVVGLYAPEELDTTDETIPSIADMTEYALQQLSTDKDGFFLMVEGAQIDDFAEKNNLERELEEIYNFDCAVEVAKKYVEKNPDTVLIVTADHETGDVESPMDQTAEQVLELTTYSTELHTYKSVPVFAMGPQTEALKGTCENTEIGIFVASLLGEKEFGQVSKKNTIVSYKTEECIEGNYQLPDELFEEKAEEIQAAKVIHITIENATDQTLELPTLQFKYKNKQYVVKPQKTYCASGEKMQVDYPIPEKAWDRKFMDKVTDPTLVGKEGSSYLLKSIEVTSRTGIK